MKSLTLFVIMASCLMASAYPTPYMYRQPEPTVISSSMVSPEILMPGDTGMVAIEIENGADKYVVTYQREDFTLTMPIESAELQSTDEIEVTSTGYNDVGEIGPGDIITIYYTIKADENITDGTHFLDFRMICGPDSNVKEINRKVPIKIDSTPVMVMRSEVPSRNEISLDVANPRLDTLNAVTVVPSGEGIEFSPENYYIGTMDPDEVFTINFDISGGVPSNMSFLTKFKSYETWHESEVYTVNYQPNREKPMESENLPLVMGIIALPILAVGGFYYAMKKRRPEN